MTATALDYFVRLCVALGVPLVLLWGIWQYSEPIKKWTFPFNRATLTLIIVYGAVVLWWRGIAAAAFAEWAGSLIPGKDDGHQVSAITASAGVILQSAIALGGSIYIARRCQNREGLLLEFALKPGWLRWAIGAYVARMPLALAAGNVFAFLAPAVSVAFRPILRTFQPQQVQTLEQLVAQAKDPWVLISAFVCIAILAPLGEETLFRGVLLRSLTEKLDVASAVLLSSMIFAAAHLNSQAFVQLLVMGIISAIAYLNCRTLAAPILFHALVNATLFVARVTQIL